MLTKLICRFLGHRMVATRDGLSNIAVAFDCARCGTHKCAFECGRTAEGALRGNLKLCSAARKGEW